MKISKELIEKYHNGLCSPEEIKAVEDRLFDDEFTTEPTLPIGESKASLQQVMLEEIAKELPSRRKPIVRVFLSGSIDVSRPENATYRQRYPLHLSRWDQHAAVSFLYR